MKEILREAKFYCILRMFLLPCYWVTLLVGLSESCGGRVKSFFLLISFHRGSSCSYMTWG
jgi:hypothetical protein